MKKTKQVQKAEQILKSVLWVLHIDITHSDELYLFSIKMAIKQFV